MQLDRPCLLDLFPKAFVARRLRIGFQYAPSSLLVFRKNLMRNHFPPDCMVPAETLHLQCGWRLRDYGIIFLTFLLKPIHTLPIAVLSKDERQPAAGYNAGRVNDHSPSPRMIRDKEAAQKAGPVWGAHGMRIGIHC
jgi:hypothetical protein